MPVSARCTCTRSRNRSRPYPRTAVQLVTVNGVARSGWKTSLRATSYNTTAALLFGNSGNNRCDRRYESYLPRHSLLSLPLSLSLYNSLQVERLGTTAASILEHGFTELKELWEKERNRIYIINKKTNRAIQVADKDLALSREGSTINWSSLLPRIVPRHFFPRNIFPRYFSSREPGDKFLTISSSATMWPQFLFNYFSFFASRCARRDS